jgi:hypothetical protein
MKKKALQKTVGFKVFKKKGGFFQMKKIISGIAA